VLFDPVDFGPLGKLHVGRTAGDRPDCSHYCQPGVPDVTAAALVTAVAALAPKPVGLSAVWLALAARSRRWLAGEGSAADAEAAAEAAAAAACEGLVPSDKAAATRADVKRAVKAMAARAETERQKGDANAAAKLRVLERKLDDALGTLATIERLLGGAAAAAEEAAEVAPPLLSQSQSEGRGDQPPNATAGNGHERQVDDP